MYKFTEVENNIQRGRKGLFGIRVKERSIWFGSEYTRNRNNLVYCQVVFDKDATVIAVKFSETKNESLFKINEASNTGGSKYINCKVSDVMPTGTYKYLETTREGFEVFKLLQEY